MVMTSLNSNRILTEVEVDTKEQDIAVTGWTVAA